MSRLYWLPVIAIGLALFGSSGALSYQDSAVGGPISQGEQSGTDAAQYSEMDSPAPFPAQSPVAENGVDESSDRIEEGDYANENLETQREIARWTRYLTYASVTGVAISVFAVLLVFFTFKESRRLVVETKSIGYRQLRPYLCVESINCDVYGKQPDGQDQDFPHIDLRVVLKNAGQTPALSVWKTATVSVWPYPFKEREGLALAGIGADAVGYTGSINYLDIAPGQLSEFPYKFWIGAEPWTGKPEFKKLYVYIIIKYKDFENKNWQVVDADFETAGFTQVGDRWKCLFNRPRKGGLTQRENWIQQPKS